MKTLEKAERDASTDHVNVFRAPRFTVARIAAMELEVVCAKEQEVLRIVACRDD